MINGELFVIFSWFVKVVAEGDLPIVASQELKFNVLSKLARDVLAIPIHVICKPLELQTRRKIGCSFVLLN
ncbi:hypothetical protein ACS0TY_019244 [Phlomoides rotata]